MRCRRARSAIVDARLGLLSPESEAELHRHLAVCPDCTAEERAERILARDLARVREESPVTVNVVDRVMADVAALGPVERRGASSTQLAWAALAATFSGLFVAWMAVEGVRDLRADTLVGELSVLLTGAGAVGSAALALAAGMLTVLGSLSRIVLELVSTAGVLMGKLELASRMVLAFSVASMAAVSFFVVGRDLRPLPALTRKERT